MLLPIKLICPKNKVRRDGTSIIFIQYCGVDDKKTLLNTEIAIPPNYWNRKYLRVSADLPENYGNAADLNQRLADLLRLFHFYSRFADQRMALPTSSRNPQL